MNATIEFEVIAERAELPEILASRGVEVRNGKAFCPFHENTATPAMTVFHLGGRWRFDCKGCGAKGDAIRFVSLFDRIGPVEAAAQIGGVALNRMRRNAPGLTQERSSSMSWAVGQDSGRSPHGGPIRTSADKPGAWADPEWQNVADDIISRAQDNLWSHAGRQALDWLRARGLLDLTIAQFRLGFVGRRETSRPLEVLRDGDRERGITVNRGITIPWVHPEAWYHRTSEPPGPRWVGCNVRQLMTDVFQPLPENVEKCWAFAGSQRGYLYPFADFAPGVPLLLVEGEWDSLIAWQEFGSLVNVATVGSAKQSPKAASLASMAVCPHWLVALHNDQPGNEGAKSWSARSEGRAVRSLLPPGRDLNDMHLDGVNLRDWVRGEHQTFGWPCPQTG